MLEVIAVIFAIIALTSCFLSCRALDRANDAMIEVKAMQRSTHSVQFVPMDPTGDKEAAEQLGKDEDEGWKTLGEAAMTPIA